MEKKYCRCLHHVLAIEKHEISLLAGSESTGISTWD